MAIEPNILRARAARELIQIEGSGLQDRIEALRDRGYTEAQIKEKMPKLIEAERQDAAITRTPYTEEPWSNPFESEEAWEAAGGPSSVHLTLSMTEEEYEDDNRS